MNKTEVVSETSWRTARSSGGPTVTGHILTVSAEVGADTSRRRRSDAQRNVAALLEAAKAVFAESGVDAPAKKITDLAGVGVGTLYRHFPRRSELIVAVLQHEIDGCIAAADEVRATLRPWPAVVAWIERFTDFVGTKSGLAAALHSGNPAYDNLPEHLMDQLEPAFQTLLTRATDSGHLRDDVTAREILITIALICQPVRGQQPDFNQRMVAILTDGLARPRKRRTPHSDNKP